jgi:hypothetical protein
MRVDFETRRAELIAIAEYGSHPSPLEVIADFIASRSITQCLQLGEDYFG